MRLALAVMLLAVAPAVTNAADVVTYKGTLGEHDIVVELTERWDGPIVGRYSYLSQGADIPLNALDLGDDEFGLVEEAPCTETTCISQDDGSITNTPVGATWTMFFDLKGNLHGTWKGAGKTGKALEVNLREIGSRTLPEGTELTPFGLYDSAQSISYPGQAGFTPDALPYDFAKMDVPLTQGPVETIQGSTIRYVTDPRTRFAFPRIVSLADGSSADAANTVLARRHAQINSYAFDCLSLVYGGFGGRGDMVGKDMGAGTGGWSSCRPACWTWTASRAWTPRPASSGRRPAPAPVPGTCWSTR